ncbi:MAG: septation protein SpoVG family protein [Ruminococcus sp.]
MVTKLSVSKLDEPTDKGIVGFATATFDDTVTVNSITIREKQDGSGLYVRMPQRKTTNGQYIDVAHPLNGDTRKEMNNLILDCYEKGISQYDGTHMADRNTVKVEAQNCIKYEPGKYGNALGRLDIVVNDMVIHNAKLFANRNGEVNLFLPNYKDSKGEYHSICIPSNKDAYQEIKIAALKEYNTEYKYQECTPEQAEQIKDVGINVKKRDLKNGNVSVKFNANDEQRINNTLQALAAKQAIQSKPSIG